MYSYILGWNNRLIDQMDLSTLKYMREVELMTNKEIAFRLDISPATVRKYIGKQPSKQWFEEQKKLRATA